MDPKSIEGEASVTVEEEKLHFWEEVVIAAKEGVDIGAIALIVEMVTVKGVLTVVEAKTAKDLKEAATEEDKIVRDLKEAITVEAKMGKDQTEVATEEGMVAVVADTVVIMVVCYAAEAVTEVAKEESVGPHGRIMNQLMNE